MDITFSNYLFIFISYYSAFARFEIICTRSSCSALTKIRVHSEAALDREDDQDAQYIYTCLSRSPVSGAGRRLENILVFHVDVSSGFATTSSFSPNGLPNGLPLWRIAVGQKCMSRKHNGVLESDPRFFGHCDRALGTTFPPALTLPCGNPRSNTSEGQISPLNAQIKDKSR